MELLIYVQTKILNKNSYSLTIRVVALLFAQLTLRMSRKCWKIFINMNKLLIKMKWSKMHAKKISTNTRLDL